MVGAGRPAPEIRALFAGGVEQNSADPATTPTLPVLPTRATPVWGREDGRMVGTHVRPPVVVGR